MVTTLPSATSGVISLTNAPGSAANMSNLTMVASPCRADSVEAALNKAVLYHPQYTTVFVIVFIALSIAIIIGNSLVLMSFKINRRVCIKENYFLLSLSTADILTGVVVIPMYVYLLYPSHITLLQVRVYTSLDVICGIASIMNLLCLSVVRCWGIVQPLEQRGHRKRSYAIAASVIPWAMGILSVPGFLFRWHGLDDQIIFTVQVVLCYFLPLLTIAVCYLIISYVYCKRCNSVDYSTFKKNKQVAKMLGMIIGVFLLTWLPFFTLGILERYSPSNSFVQIFSQPKYYKILKFLQYTNSAANPAVYAMNIPEFKISFLIIHKRLLSLRPLLKTTSNDERACLKRAEIQTVV